MGCSRKALALAIAVVLGEALEVLGSDSSLVHLVGGNDARPTREARLVGFELEHERQEVIDRIALVNARHVEHEAQCLLSTASVRQRS